MDNLKGTTSQGWLKDFIGHGLTAETAKSTVQTQLIGYAVTFARGLATIGVAWLVVKFTHRRAALIALLLNSAALPLIYMPHYSLFVLGRMFMGFGGTMLIILVQPIIARFFDLRGKGILSAITPTAYLFGALVAHSLFVYEGTTSGGPLKYFQDNWKTVASICAGLSLIPLVGYFLFAKNFNTADNAEQELEQLEKPENTYSGIIKERSLWFWIFWYSFLLVASLMVSWVTPELVGKINQSLVKSLDSAHVSWKRIYCCCFYVGCLGGMCIGKWSKLQFQRKPCVVGCCLIGVLCWALIFGAAHISDTSIASVVIFYSVFIFAFFAMGVQSVILYIPHEYPENKNPKRLTIFYSYLWGIGYIIFTVYKIIVDSCSDNIGAKESSTGAYVALGLISFFVVMFLVMALTIKEPRPEYKFTPWFDRPAFLGKGSQALRVE
ncbi:mycoplasma MFS transporter [Candidatus Mycoplasma haematohominis]|uniref:Mycoplasma MFS transporter n=1 Tax=Candidatus Mycoplasma haematohominis TaxID=1494318 RepID=A0A478FPF8_9MOLU|nr:mycoplasma MFS transporter [Candidatus Mycoplasma haemohominis]